MVWPPSELSDKEDRPAMTASAWQAARGLCHTSNESRRLRHDNRRTRGHASMSTGMTGRVVTGRSKTARPPRRCGCFRPACPGVSHRPMPAAAGGCGSSSRAHCAAVCWRYGLTAAPSGAACRTWPPRLPHVTRRPCCAVRCSASAVRRRPLA
jgi:hypothetical protein